MVICATFYCGSRTRSAVIAYGKMDATTSAFLAWCKQSGGIKQHGGIGLHQFPINEGTLPYFLLRQMPLALLTPSSHVHRSSRAGGSGFMALQDFPEPAEVLIVPDAAQIRSDNPNCLMSSSLDAPFPSHNAASHSHPQANMSLEPWW